MYVCMCVCMYVWMDVYVWMDGCMLRHRGDTGRYVCSNCFDLRLFICFISEIYADMLFVAMCVEHWSFSPRENHLVGPVVRRPPREREIPGSNPACAGIFFGSSHTSDLKIGTPVATLPGAWRYRVSTGTGRPGVSILWLGEVERLICNFYLSVAARKIVWADPSLRYTSLLLGC